MKDIIERTPLTSDPREEQRPAPLWRRLAWLVAIWTASVALLGAVAYLIRLWLGV